MKKCSNCNLEKELAGFSHDKRSKDGKCTVCKTCRHKYYQDNKETILKNSKEYYYSHRERLINNTIERRRMNKEKYAKIRRKYYESHRSELAERNRKYYKFNQKVSRLYQESSVVGMTFTQFKKEYQKNEKMHQM